MAEIWSLHFTIWSASFMMTLFHDIKIIEIKLNIRWLIEASGKMRIKEIRLRIRMTRFQKVDERQGNG